MSPDIALSVLVSRDISTETMSEKRIHKSASSPDLSSGSNRQDDSSSSSSSSSSTTTPPTRPSSNSFSFSSFKSFFTNPGPATTGTVRKVPAFLMIATTALLFTSTSTGGYFAILPQAHASAVPVPQPSTTSYLTDPLVSASLAIRNSNSNSPFTASIQTSEHDQSILLHKRQVASAPAPAPIPHPEPGPIKWNTPCRHPHEEGIWNCMTTTWQRCAQGRWSVIMRSSSAGGVPEIHEPGYNKEDIICVPAGVSHEVRFVSRKEMEAVRLVGPTSGGSGTASGTGTGTGNAAEGPALGATSGNNGVVGASGGSVGTETKWGGGGWNGRYWSGAERSARERIVVVLAVAGAVSVMFGVF